MPAVEMRMGLALRGRQQGLEHGVGDANQLRRGLVRRLGLQQIGRFFIEVDVRAASLRRQALLVDYVLRIAIDLRLACCDADAADELADSGTERGRAIV